MHPTPFTFSHEQITLHGLKVGQGTEVWLAFHGFGQGPEALLGWAKPLVDHCTLYLMELPFHGSSHVWAVGAPIEAKAMGAYFKAFLNANAIEHFSVSGYSLGGRLALFCALHFESQITQLCLMAPDGLIDRIWYGMATRHAPGRWLFKRLMHNPKPLLATSTWLHKVGLLNASFLKFVQQPLGDTNMRRQIYGSWLATSRLYLRGNKLASTLQKAPYPIIVFYGTYDRVIPFARYRRFLKLMPRAHVVMLPTGHSHLPAAAGAWLENHQSLLLHKAESAA